MATKQRFIDTGHRTDRSKNVILTITIGDDQIGGSVVKFRGDNHILRVGTVQGLNLGKGGTLIGKTLEVRTKFYDRNEYSNNISAIYNFNNGNVPLHVYYDEVENDGDEFIFIISFLFT